MRESFEKDRAEKSFLCMKGVMDMDWVRFRLASPVKGHILVCYLAYLLLSVLGYKLKDLKMTRTEVLEILATMYRVYLTDSKSQNKFVKTVTLSRVQEYIFKAVSPRLVAKWSV